MGSDPSLRDVTGAGIDSRRREPRELQDIRIFNTEDKVPTSVGLLVDTSGSMIDVLPYMTKGIRDFTRSFPANNEFHVISFGTRPRLVHTHRFRVSGICIRAL
jgi:hypothetical protein